MRLLTISMLFAALCVNSTTATLERLEKMHFGGRWWRDNSGKSMNHSWGVGTFIVRFSGSTTITMRMVSALSGAYYTCQIDDRPEIRLFHNNESKNFRLFSGLSLEEEHVVRCGRNNEASYGPTKIMGIIIDNDGKILQVDNPNADDAMLRVEAIGDSITAGFQVTVPVGAQYPATIENQDVFKTYIRYMADGWGTSDYRVIAKSGVSILDYGTTGIVMPREWPCREFWSGWQGSCPAQWDFNSWQADLVMINLGTNDFVFGDPTQEQFREGYFNFLKDIRTKYPNALIACIEPLQRSCGGENYPKLNGIVNGLEQAVNDMEDSKVIYYETGSTADPWLVCSQDYVDYTHPTAGGNEKFAARLLDKMTKDVRRFFPNKCGGSGSVCVGSGNPPNPSGNLRPSAAPILPTSAITTDNPSASPSGFCNFGFDGTGASSVCEGGAQGGTYCNQNKNECEQSCGGKWCTENTIDDTYCPTGYQKGRFTSYTSFAECCEDSPNYDPSADTSECDYYNACAYPGVFAYVPRMTFEEVQTTNIVAFYSVSNNGVYKGKTIRVLKDPLGVTSASSSNTVDSIIADTCGDNDCNGCCTANAAPSGGFLVDMEYWTVLNNFGTINAARGDICWKIVDDVQPTSAPINFTTAPTNIRTPAPINPTPAPTNTAPPPQPSPSPNSGQSTAGFCNWGLDGTAVSSTCTGGAQGGIFCNQSKNSCEISCRGNWCAVDDIQPTPTPTSLTYIPTNLPTVAPINPTPNPTNPPTSAPTNPTSTPTNLPSSAPSNPITPPQPSASPNSVQSIAGFCNWGLDGKASSSTCAGGAQGSEFCNQSEDSCKNGCGGNWCAAFCNWGPDGTGASSICEGGAQGGYYCNGSKNGCESCGGRWCP